MSAAKITWTADNGKKHSRPRGPADDQLDRMRRSFDIQIEDVGADGKFLNAKPVHDQPKLTARGKVITSPASPEALARLTQAIAPNSTEARLDRIEAMLTKILQGKTK